MVINLHLLHQTFVNPQPILLPLRTTIRSLPNTLLPTSVTGSLSSPPHRISTDSSISIDPLSPSSATLTWLEIQPQRPHHIPSSVSTETRIHTVSLQVLLTLCSKMSLSGSPIRISMMLPILFFPKLRLPFLPLMLASWMLEPYHHQIHYRIELYLKRTIE